MSQRLRHQELKVIPVGDGIPFPLPPTLPAAFALSHASAAGSRTADPAHGSEGRPAVRENRLSSSPSSIALTQEQPPSVDPRAKQLRRGRRSNGRRSKRRAPTRTERRATPKTDPKPGDPPRPNPKKVPHPRAKPTLGSLVMTGMVVV